jgi:hypothetical protein
MAFSAAEDLDMLNTPASTPPRYSMPGLTAQDLEASERDLFDLLRKALEPTFVLVRRLGAGGMGIVYLARDPALKRLVAVKVLSPERAGDAEARARFQREAEAVAKISHPNVVAVYSVGELANDLPYLVMQYVEGRSMAERLVEEGPLEIGETKAIMGQVAAALAAAHAKGIIHRDIKAANILWDDASGRALVSDFGIAAVLENEAEGDPMQLTQTGVVVGTPRYMSPEQLLAERVSAKTDVYSLGLLGYELLAREGPFPHSSPNQMIVAHLRDAPRPISTLRADVDPAFEALLAACLEKDPHSRPDAEDIARRLRHSTSVVLEWPPPGLEDLQGAAVGAARQMFLGSLAVAVPLAALVTQRPGGLLYGEGSAAVATPLMIAAGGVVCVHAAAALARLLPLVRRALGAGYGWGVICAVLADIEKDMGAVMAGEREYAALSLLERDRIRRWRVTRLALSLGGAVWGVAGVFLALPLAARLADSDTAFGLTLLGGPLASLLASIWLVERERTLLRPVRERMRRHSSHIDRLTGLAAAWRSAFDRVTADVRINRVGRAGRRVAAAAMVGITAAAGLTTIVGMTVISSAGKMGVAVGIPTYDRFQDRLSKLDRLRVLRPTEDPSITPLEAGEALLALSEAGRGAPPDRFLKPPPAALPAIVLPEYHREFGAEWERGSAMRAAARGLSATQRAFLESAAKTSGEMQLRALAYAGQVDWISAAVVQPIPREMLVFDLPIPRSNPIRRAVSGQFARAALARADGRVADAERMLREVIGAGFSLMGEMTIIENLVGSTIVDRGREELVAFYETTGRAGEARQISSAMDPRPRDDLTEPRLTAAQQEVYIAQTIQDSARAPGVRWEMATRFATFKPCMELRDMVFGPGPDYYAVLAEARKGLVHTAGEDAVMRMAETQLEGGVPADRVGTSIAQRSLRGFAAAVDAMTGSKRMSVCASFMGGRR